MDKTVEVNFSPSDVFNHTISISFLVYINRLEEGKISNLTIHDEPFITGWLVFGEESSEIDNTSWIFKELYLSLKNKDKVFLKNNLEKKEFKLIWKERKPLKSLLKTLRQKYPELIELK